MFEKLSEKFQGIFKTLKGEARISDSNISLAIREMKLALLEADVHFQVVKELLEKIKQKSLGEEVIRSLTPGQQFVKIVKEELEDLFGDDNRELKISSQSPAILMIVGLQGSGKTTTAAKLGALLKKDGRFPLLVPADIYRPAAIEQLIKISQVAGLSYYKESKGKRPEDICRDAMREATQTGFDTLIVDTAGRLHIDDELMNELVSLKEILKPAEILYIADAMTGQDAVKSASEFHKKLSLSGIILTKLDGDARGGAALSIRYVTKVPIKFVGVGEKVDELEAFYPERISSRIIGMGDLLTFIEKAGEAFEQKEALKLQKKIRKNEFSLDDFRDQLMKIKKMGSLNSIMEMIPGFGAMRNVDVDDREMDRVIAIVNSMTFSERENPKIINGSRKRRIAKGSGRSIQEINQLIKQFSQMKKMMKQFRDMKGMKGLKGLGLPFSRK